MLTGYEVQAFASVTDFIAHGVAARPECVVAEALLGDLGGLELMERLRELDPTIPVVFASRSGDVRLIVRAMRAGAVDFLQKPVAEARLREAVARAVERTVAMRALELRRASALERFARLTPRERVILAQILQGRLNKQIAATLACQEATVKVHRSRLMRKLGVRSLARLAQFGQEIGLDRRVAE